MDRLILSSFLVMSSSCQQPRAHETRGRDHLDVVEVHSVAGALTLQHAGGVEAEVDTVGRHLGAALMIIVFAAWNRGLSICLDHIVTS